MEVLKLASSKGFEIELLTSGKFLAADILPLLLPHLAVLRISVPPFLHGYNHLQTIRDQIKGAVDYRNREGLKTKIVTSLLVRPDTPEGEIVKDVQILSGLGVDSIRFKPTHVYDERGNLYLDIFAYQGIMGFILGLNNPKVIISKIDRLAKDGARNYSCCYYTDFNPFVVGADGKNYACCEHKYHDEYQRGDFNNQSAEEILEFTSQNPQAILPGCFTGCKGDLANRFLYALIKGYELMGDSIFSREEYQKIADEASISLIRSHPRT